MNNWPPTPETLAIQIRELEKRLDREIAHAKEISAGAQRALDLQATEYERRLEALNGEANRIAANNARNVSRELFDALLARVNLLENYRSNMEGRIWGISIAVGVVVTLINIGLRLIK